MEFQDYHKNQGYAQLLWPPTFGQYNPVYTIQSFFCKPIMNSLKRIKKIREFFHLNSNLKDTAAFSAKMQRSIESISVEINCRSRSSTVCVTNCLVFATETSVTALVKEYSGMHTANQPGENSVQQYV